MKTQRLLAIALGALVSGTGRAETITYSYDDAGRLTNAAYSGGAGIAYVYDDNGNLLQRTTTAGGAVTHTLIYRAGTGGSVDGLPVVTQQVAQGQSGAAVAAVVEEAGAAFGRWSDGKTDVTRTDVNVQADLDVTAQFRSTGGADLDWYAARGIAPESGETWADVDARAVPAKGTTLLHENIADTDPSDPSDTFRILAISNGPPVGVAFAPASAARDYALQATTQLTTGPWTNVPGAGPRTGTGGPDAMSDDGAEPARFYRVKVEVP